MNTSEIFERMRTDHRNVLREIAALEAAADGASGVRGPDWPGEDVRRVLAMLARQFDTHMAAEDEVLFPALLEALPETRISIEPLQSDHAALRLMLEDLEDSLVETPGEARNEQVAVQLRDFVDLLRIHIRKEEAVVIAVAERVLRPREVDALARRFARGRSTSTAGPGAGPGWKGDSE